MHKLKTGMPEDSMNFNFKIQMDEYLEKCTVQEQQGNREDLMMALDRAVCLKFKTS